MIRRPYFQDVAEAADEARETHTRVELDVAGYFVTAEQLRQHYPGVKHTARVAAWHYYVRDTRGTIVADARTPESLGYAAAQFFFSKEVYA